METKALQQSIINKIFGLTDTRKLRQLSVIVEQLTDNSDVLERLAKPMRKKLSIEELKKEQNFKSINKKAFFKKLDALEIEEPIEDLIAMI
jgi:regulator of PEP synthase PpsR (kinase-PPPase family)